MHNLISKTGKIRDKLLMKAVFSCIYQVRALVLLMALIFSSVSIFGSNNAFSTYSELAVRGELPQNPFVLGEELVYSISYMGISGGELKLQIKDVTIYDESLCYIITASIKSNSTFSLFFKVDDYVESIYDVIGGFSRRYYIKQEEGKYENEKSILLDYQNNKAGFHSQGKDDKEVKIVERYLQDSLSVFYEIRKRDFEKQDLYEIAVISGKKEYDLKVELLGRKKLKTAIGTYNTFHVKPFLLKEGEFKDKGDLEVFITDDHRKIPVLMTLEVVFGNVRADLKSARIPSIN